jgi:uncharacterized protein involved in exopolysaccharide biosynthesis
MEQNQDILHYVEVLKTRKKFFITPAVVVFLVATAIALLLPAIYESSSTILIEEQQIPPDFVRSIVTGFADQRIQSLTQQIMSRTKLWEIIQKFNLYPELKDKLTREEIIEKMKDSIKLDTISADIVERPKSRGGTHLSITIAFSVAIEVEILKRSRKWQVPWPPYIWNRTSSSERSRPRPPPNF